MASLIFLVVLGLVVQCFGQNSYYFENHKYCDDLSPTYGDINLEQIAGVWYGVEKIPHSKGEYRIEYTSQECFYIDIKERYIEVSDLYYLLACNSHLTQNITFKNYKM